MDNNSISKIAEAIEFIETNLTDKLDLATVAAAVHYSKYHFHRVFTQTVGLTVHEYIQRRQLTEAAKLLVFSKLPIIDIAAMAGYESQQAFTNIFTAMYKQSPNRYREEERFYPLQLKFKLEGDYKTPDSKELNLRNIVFAAQEDVACWMDLVRLVIDGFPHLYEAEYLAELKQRIQTKQALILKDGNIAVGIMLFAYATSSIDFMGIHPLYRKLGIPQALVTKVMQALLPSEQISITTYRAGDRADTGHRQAVKELGFAEAELLVEFGYPTQRFTLSKECYREQGNS